MSFSFEMDNFLAWLWNFNARPPVDLRCMLVHVRPVPTNTGVWETFGSGRETAEQFIRNRSEPIFFSMLNEEGQNIWEFRISAASESTASESIRKHFKRFLEILERRR